MKDRVARAVISMLVKRIDYLHDELRRIKKPHVENCKCDLCTGWRGDPFILTFQDGEAHKLLNGEL